MVVASNRKDWHVAGLMFNITVTGIILVLPGPKSRLTMLECT